MARLDYGPWSLLLASFVILLAGRRLAFATTWHLPDGWQFTHFVKSLGVLLMFAGMITWLAAVGLLVLRLGRFGHP